jgi:hypothetical protein
VNRAALPDDLRAEIAAYRAAMLVQSEAYDVGYIVGWYKARMGAHGAMFQGSGRRFGYRDADSIREARLGHAHGLLDGQGREGPWWPDYARGTNGMERPATPRKALEPASAIPPGALWRMEIEDA